MWECEIFHWLVLLIGRVLKSVKLKTFTKYKSWTLKPYQKEQVKRLHWNVNIQKNIDCIDQEFCSKSKRFLCMCLCVELLVALIDFSIEEKNNKTKEKEFSPQHLFLARIVQVTKRKKFNRIRGKRNIENEKINSSNTSP